MGSPRPHYGREEFARRGDDIYDRVVASRLREEELGRFVLMDIDSEDYEILFDVHEAEIVWNERLRRIFVDTANTDPLVGMAPLDGHELTVQVINEGAVFIKALP